MLDYAGVGSALKAAREAAGLSQAEVGRRIARDLGRRRFTATGVSYIENGKVSSPLTTLAAFARAVECRLAVDVVRSEDPLVPVAVPADAAEAARALAGLPADDRRRLARLAAALGDAPEATKDAVVLIVEEAAASARRPEAV